MPKVNVEQSVKGSGEDVYKAVKKYLTERGTLEKLGGEIVWEDDSRTGSIESDKFSGEIEVNEDGAESLVTISIDLPFLLAPFKGKVKEELSKHLSRLKV